MLRGRFPEATARCREALAIARGVGARAEEGQALNTLGLCLADAGDRAAGEDALRRALAIAYELQQCGRHRPRVLQPRRLRRPGRADRGCPPVSLDGVEACRALGLLGGYLGLLRCEGAQRLIRLGRHDEAEALVERAIAARPGGMVEGLAQGTRGLLDIARGDRRRRRERFALAREHLGRGRVALVDRHDRRGGGGARAVGRPAGGRARGGGPRAGAARGAGRRVPRLRLLWVGVRAETDLAERARTPADAEALGNGRGAGGGARAPASRSRSPRTRGRARRLPRRCCTTRSARASGRASRTRRIRPRGRRRSTGRTGSASSPTRPTPAGAARRRPSRSATGMRPRSRCAPRRPRRPGSVPRPVLDAIVALARRGRVDLGDRTGRRDRAPSSGSA